MRVNSRVLTEKTDLLDGIRIPNCPTQFRYVAEQLMMLLTKPGYATGDYNSVTELDKILTVDFWREYDGFMSPENEIMYPSREQAYQAARNWFINTATSPDLITRARRWLAEHNYVFIKESVAERAHEASGKFSKAVRGK